MLAVAGYAAFMTGGTRLLYENSVWEPIGATTHGLSGGQVLLVPGLICLKAGFVPKAKRPRKVKTVVRYASVTPPAPGSVSAAPADQGLPCMRQSQIRRTRRFAASAARTGNR
ncbi:MAG: hypothetical protein ACLSB9_00055 [Hydrogeniiclostridium mannosilyticum]